MAPTSPSAGASPVTWSIASRTGQYRRSPVCRSRAQVGFHAGKDRLLPARPAPEDAEFPVEPERGGRSRRLYRLAAQIERATREQAQKSTLSALLRRPICPIAIPADQDGWRFRSTLLEPPDATAEGEAGRFRA